MTGFLVLTPRASRALLSYLALPSHQEKYSIALEKAYIFA